MKLIEAGDDMSKWLPGVFTFVRFFNFYSVFACYFTYEYMVTFKHVI